MFFKQFESVLCVVEGKNDDVVERSGGGAVGDGNPIGSIRIPQTVGLVICSLRRSRSAVVRPFDFGNLGASGERSEALMVTITASVPEFMNRTFRSSGCGSTNVPRRPLRIRWPA